MSSQTVGSAQNASSASFPSAQLRISSNSKAVPVWVHVFGTISWKPKDSRGNDVPQSLNDFRSESSLEIERMQDGTTWDEVEDAVKPGEHNGKPSVLVPGLLHGPDYLKRLPRSRNVEIELIAENDQQRDQWLHLIRNRIAPWKLLHERIRASIRSHGFKELRKELGQMTSGSVAYGPSSQSLSGSNTSNKFAMFDEKLQKWNWADSVFAQGTTAVETTAIIAKLMQSVDTAADAAEMVADITKGVAGISTAFQILALSARLIGKIAEAKRSDHVIPGVLEKNLRLQRYVQESMVGIIRCSSKVEDIEEEFALSLLEQVVESIYKIVAQLLRGTLGKTRHADVVKEVEEKMDRLLHKAVTARNTSELAQIKHESHDSIDEIHHIRPECSPFFSGRTKEIEDIIRILNQYGSAAITQFGGVGKTELAIAVAVKLEEDDQVTGGVFWITMDGNEKKAIDSLATLVEKFTGRTMADSDRTNDGYVVAMLRRELSKKKGRWFLCLDNADEARTSAVLDAVCSIVEPSKKNGFVVVTSRRSEPNMWTSMKDEQKLDLSPLQIEDAMVLLWRQVYVLKSKDVSDTDVVSEMEKLKGVDISEYNALEELCGNDSLYSLGCLPLAIVQAAAYVRRYKRSFKQYLDLFRNADTKRKLGKLLKKAERLTLTNDSQKSVLTTWCISVERLSPTAYNVLRSMSMLAADAIPESIMNRLLEQAGHESESDEEILSDDIVEELVYGSSLLTCAETKDRRTFRMHRLVRRFVLVDMERRSKKWMETFNATLVTMHDMIGDVLEKEGNSFSNVCRTHVFRSHHRVYMHHSVALIENIDDLPSSQLVHFYAELQDMLQDIHKYAGFSLSFYGMVHKAVIVWRSLLSVGDAFGEDFTKKNEIISFALVNLGAALIQAGNLAESSSKLERCLKMLRDIYGSKATHPDIADCLINLGTVHYGQRNYGEATVKYEESMAMYRAIHGSNVAHRDIAVCSNNLGNVYFSQEKYGDATEKYEESMAMYRDIHGANTAHHDIAVCLINLGNVYSNQEKYGEAAAKYEESLAMYRDIHGSNPVHHDIASCLNNLGRVYHKQEKYGEAVAKYEESLEMYRLIHGPDAVHRDIARYLNNLGVAYGKQEKYIEAAVKYEECLVMLRAIHGLESSHAHILAVLENLTWVFKKQNKHPEAATIYNELNELKNSGMNSTMMGRESAIL